MSDAQHLSDLRIVLMGYRVAGKSSSGNTILDREEFDLKRSAHCVRRHGEVADRHITVIEAPGWRMNQTVEESPEILKQEILLSVSLCPPGPHAVLLIIRVDSRFKENEIKALQGHLDLLSERVWSHTIVLFTHGDSLLDTSIEQHIESEGQDLQRLLDKCGNRYHVLNNHNRSDDTQIKELLEKIEETVAQNNGRHFEINSFRSRFGAETVLSSSRSRDSSLTSYEWVIKRYNSNEWLPPNMSGDERLDRWSRGSSGYGSSSSQSSDSDSVFSSSSSTVSSYSSGFRLLRSILEFVEYSGTRQRVGATEISKNYPRSVKKHDKHEEDTEKT
ncbi:GTPase IMAP family member 9-like [Megalobrama amblycephala]|uniref:GTPase IMAP family member 9-like n=1 Tax=Megalobrama amblycephala TaxID=75352 RepID=UPI002013FFD7|nr:GTPase IMAP family member 9-like [Megalobrama amblycephala]